MPNLTGSPVLRLEIHRRYCTLYNVQCTVLIPNSNFQYFNTFGGNAVSCAAAEAVLDVINKEELKENALKVGNYLLDGFKKIKEKSKLISDVRGHGLFLGIELMKDGIPNTTDAYKIR